MKKVILFAGTAILIFSNSLAENRPAYGYQYRQFHLVLRKFTC